MARKDVIELNLDDPLSPKMASAHLYLPCEGPVSQLVLIVDAEKVDDTLSAEVPVQFQLRFGENVVGTFLKKGADGYSVKMDARVLKSVLLMLSHDEIPVEDLSTNYWVRGRRLGADAEWIDYATGMVTFTCGGDRVDRKDAKVVSKVP